MKDIFKQLANLPQEQREKVLAQLRKKTDNKAHSTEISNTSTANEGDAHKWPLSFMQLRLWMLDSIEGSSSAYNMATALKLDGTLNVSALQSALHLMISRHDILRACFALEDSTPVQIIAQDSHYPELEVIEADAQYQAQHMTQFVNQPFDLKCEDGGLLIRYQLLKQSEQEHVLLINLHHIIADGWSISLIANEISIAYQQLAKGEQPSLHPIKYQYGDFARSLESVEKNKKHEELLEFWLAKLDDAPPLLELPLDKPRPAQASNKGVGFDFNIDDKLRNELEQIARSQGITLYMLLLGAYNLLLSRYTNQHDILVGTPVANRSAQWQDLIGMFVNTLVIRSEIDPQASVRDYLAQIKSTCLEAFSKQDLPIELLVEKLQPKRTLSHAPVIQNMFALHDARRDKLALEGLTINKLQLPVEHVKFDLLMSLELQNQGLTGRVEYNIDIYNRSTIERFVTHYINLLQSMVSGVERNIMSLPLLSEHEVQQQHSWNNTEQSFETGVLMHELFIRQAQRTPDVTALVYNNQKMTYSELLQRAGQLSYKLRAQGVKPGELVAVICDKGMEQVVAVLAVQMSGGAYIPIETSWPKERVEHLLKFGLVKQVITQQNVMSRAVLPESVAQSYVLHFIDVNDTLDSTLPLALDIVQKPGDIAYVIFTSGSTGMPKGVVIQHQAAVNTLLDINHRYQVSAKDSAIAISALSFDLSVYDIYGLLAVGGRVVIPQEEYNKDPGYWLQLMEANDVTLWNTVPALMKMLVDYCITRNEKPTETLRWCFMSGDWIPLELPVNIKTVSPNIEVHSGGGATEASIWSITFPIEKMELHLNSIPYGRPLANQKFFILNDHLQPCPLRVTGNLFIGGVGLAHSYWRDEDKTNQHFIIHPQTGDRLYRTGDLGRFVEGGLIEFMGRADFQVKINGYRIELGEIEAVIRTQAGVKDVLAVVKDNGNSKRIAVYIMAIDGDKSLINLDLIKEKISLSLPNYMIPSAYVVLDSFPLTANGKVNQKALPQPVFALESDHDEAPRNEAETTIGQLFCSVLERESVGIKQSFFELGGHSLSAAQLVARIINIFKVDLTVKELFIHNTVEMLAKRVAQLRAGSSRPSLEVIEQNRSLQLASYGQQGLWLQAELDLAAKAYNMPAAIKLKGQLDVERLQNAMNLIVGRHESLRTRFFESGDELMQEVLPAKDIVLTRLDWTDKATDTIDQHAKALAYEDAAKPFDLGAGHLLRMTLIDVAQDEYILLFCIHHIVCDGWSFMVMLRELSTVYASDDLVTSLEELTYQYVDYSQWQRNWLAQGEMEKQLTYWRKKLSGVPQVQFPYELSGSSNNSGVGFTLPFAIPTEVSKQLLSIGQAKGVTPYVLLISVFKLLVGWYTKQTDITVGTTSAGRKLVELESLIGFFANQLVIRTKLDTKLTFVELLENVRHEILDALDNQEVPYMLVAQELDKVNQDKTPLFRAKFVYQGQMDNGLDLPNSHSESLYVDNGSAKFDLLMIMGEKNGQLSGTLQYREHCFSGGAIKGFMDMWQALLDELVTQQEQIQHRTLATLQLALNNRQQQLLSKASAAPLKSFKRKSLHCSD